MDDRDTRRRLGRQLAALRRAAGHTQHSFAPLTHYGRSTIANVETGAQRAPREFWARCDDVVGARGRLLAAYDAATVAHRPSDLATGSTSVAGPPDLATFLVLPQPDPEPLGPPLDELEQAVARIRSRYQSGRYSELVRQLPWLASAVRRHTVSGGPADQRRAHAVAAAVYQTAAGVLLKHGDRTLAAVAADRSVQAAGLTENPLVMAAGARAQVHTLMASRHAREAVALAAMTAERLAHEPSASSDGMLSVRGALLLRAATAAARAEDRSGALGLLHEADSLARQLGRDANVCWTAFGPTNVVLHRIAAAVDLGDAGTAVQLAEEVDLDRVPLPERRAVLFIDVARAYLQWGKDERALAAVRTAERHAPEEVRDRPLVHRLLQELARRCRSSMRRDVGDYAYSLGIAV